MKTICLFLILLFPVSALGECLIGDSPNEHDLNKIRELRVAQEALFEKNAKPDVVSCLYKLAKAEAEIALVEKDYDSPTSASKVLMGLDPSDSWGTVYFILASQGKGSYSNELLSEYIKDMSRANTEDRFLKFLATRLVNDTKANHRLEMDAAKKSRRAPQP